MVRLRRHSRRCVQESLTRQCSVTLGLCLSALLGAKPVYLAIILFLCAVCNNTICPKKCKLINHVESEPALVEDAVKYVIFLVDANSLFDTALGMYDFSLVLMIAQHAQKDPREYLPFLRELRALDKFYQRFRNLRKALTSQQRTFEKNTPHFCNSWIFDLKHSNCCLK